LEKYTKNDKNLSLSNTLEKYTKNNKNYMKPIRASTDMQNDFDTLNNCVRNNLNSYQQMESYNKSSNNVYVKNDTMNDIIQEDLNQLPHNNNLKHEKVSDSQAKKYDEISHLKSSYEKDLYEKGKSHTNEVEEFKANMNDNDEVWDCAEGGCVKTIGILNDSHMNSGKTGGSEPHPFALNQGTFNSFINQNKNASFKMGPSSLTERKMH